ncbi:MAG: selenium cofactor biosynthesis protein YqeC [Candidatus Ventricola sp.]
MNSPDNQAAVYFLEADRLVSATLQDAFPFLGEPGHAVSLVGGGGKTTLMYALAEASRRRGLRTAVMTTTKIGRPGTYCRTMAACQACWAAGEYAVCGERLGERKLVAPEPAVLAQLLAQAEALFIEADGARRLPCKAPAAHEPVILPETDTVIAVMGLDALGQPVGEICLRTEIVQALLGCGPEHRLTEEDMVRLLLSEQGSRKGVGQRDFFVVLNKCDGAQRLNAGRRMLELLRGQGQTRAVLTAGLRRSETYEQIKTE